MCGHLRLVSLKIYGIAPIEADDRKPGEALDNIHLFKQPAQMCQL